MKYSDRMKNMKNVWQSNLFYWNFEQFVSVKWLKSPCSQSYEPLKTTHLKFFPVKKKKKSIHALK